MKIKHASKVHADTLLSRQDVWREFQVKVAEGIEQAQAHGRFLTKIKVHPDVSDAAPMVEELKNLGYAASLMGSDEPLLIVSWRAPK